jgi:cellulose synthase/poly-beta-1,6-N-acetylglucosamine synthase-like glycosyltransferase
VLSQVDVEVEVLVIDGGSVDRTVELVDDLAREDSRVRLLRNPRTVIPAGLNVGLQHSRGTYVARLDGHTSYSDDYLARALRWFADEPRLGAVGGLRTGIGHTRVGRAIALVLSSPFAIGNSVNHFGSTRQLTDHAAFGVWRADAARDIDGWDEDLLVNEDVDFDHRILQAGHLIGFDPEMHVDWEVRDSLPALFRQYRRYGRGKGLMVLKNGAGALRVRHLVPPLAVIAGTGLLVASPLHPRLLLAALPYALAVTGMSVKVWRSRSDREADIAPSALPIAFVIVHVSWGLGMLEGLVLRLQPRIASGQASVAQNVDVSPASTAL